MDGAATTIGEADQQAQGSTLTGASDATPSSTPAVVTPASPAAEASGTARTDASPQAQVDEAAWDRLTAGEDAKRIQQSPGPVDPSPDRPADTARPPSTTTTTNADAPAAAGKYEGLDAAGEQALRRAKLLPDEEAWKALPAAVRQNLVGNAQYVLRERGRRSQQIGQPNQQTSSRTADPRRGPAAPSPAADLNQQAADGDEFADAAADDPYLDQDDEAGQADVVPTTTRGQRAADDRAERPQPGRAARGNAAPTRQQAPPDVDQAFAGLDEYVGAEQTRPIKDAFRGVVSENAQLREQLQAQQAQNQLIAAQVYGPQESEAWSELTKAMGRPVNPHEQQAIRQRANVFLQSSLAANEPMPWKQALKLASQGLFEPDIKLQAQRELAEGRRNSVRRSPAPPTSAAPRSGTPKQSEIDDAAWDGLSAGRSADELRHSYV